MRINSIHTIKKEFNLRNNEIERAVRLITDFMKELEVEKKSRIRVGLSVEEAMLRFQERLGEEANCMLILGKLMGRPYISLSVEGEEYNPFELYDDDSDDFGIGGNHLLENLGLVPVYSREKGYNRLMFKIRKQTSNPILLLAIAVLAALVIGFAGMHMPEHILKVVTDGLITPLCDTFFDVLGVIAGPVTFLSIAWGIYGIGDAAVFGRIGKQMVFHFLGMLVLISVVMCGLSAPFFDLKFTLSSSISSHFTAIVDMLLGFFPKDIFSPFIEGNFLQIVLMAFVTGIALLVLNRQTTVVADAIEQLNYIMQYIMEIIGRSIPALVFVILLQLMWSGSVTVAIKAMKPIFVITCVSFLIAAVMVFITALVFKVNPADLLRKTIKTFALAAVTASSAAAFQTCVDTCENKLGIQNRIPKFGVPIGLSLFPISSVATYMIVCLYMAEIYEVECSPMWIVMLIFASIVLSIATPPMPGGAVACYAILFLQLGIPDAGLGIALALDIVLDFIITGINVFCLQYELVFQAKKLNLIDEAVLRKA